jgi:hypothetical protein
MPGKAKLKLRQVKEDSELKNKWTPRAVQLCSKDQGSSTGAASSLVAAAGPGEAAYKDLQIGTGSTCQRWFKFKPQQGTKVDARLAETD